MLSGGRWYKIACWTNISVNLIHPHYAFFFFFFQIKIMLMGAEAKPCVSHIKNKQKKY